jgi:hypothetical protein
MSYKDARLNQLLRVHLDGIPLDLAGRLLPLRTYLRLSVLLHIHMHAVFGRRAQNSSGEDVQQKRFARGAFLGLIDGLEGAVKKMTWSPQGVWADYYAERPSYESGAVEHKKQLVAEFLDILNPGIVWDLGANTGLFSRIASDRGIPTVSFDMDPACVEMNYLASVTKGEKTILPLLLDLANPSPKIGWENEERNSLFDRGPADAVLALALIHHLAIGNNLPLSRIAGFFGRVGRSLIVEFGPKGDPMVQRLLRTRADIFPDYTPECFEKEFNEFFTIVRSVQIRNSQRTLYLMKKK